MSQGRGINHPAGSSQDPYLTPIEALAPRIPYATQCLPRQGGETRGKLHTGQCPNPSAQGCPRSQPRQSPLALAGPARLPSSSQGIVSGHVGKPREAKPRHTEGRVGREEGPTCTGTTTVTTSPGVPPAPSLGRVPTAATKPLQAPSCPSWRVPQGWDSRMHR